MSEAEPCGEDQASIWQPPSIGYALPEEYRRQLTEGLARMQREMEEFDRLEQEGLLRPRRRSQTGNTVVYSVRLDRAEVEALERRAALTGLKPTVLARNLIRVGLSTRVRAQGSEQVSQAVESAEAAIATLRTLVT